MGTEPKQINDNHNYTDHMARIARVLYCDILSD